MPQSSRPHVAEAAPDSYRISGRDYLRSVNDD